MASPMLQTCQGEGRRRAAVYTPLWHKDNYEFWYAVCIVISVVFALVYRSLRERMF
jgi:hypothetical protein